jgi:hypothetical protein
MILRKKENKMPCGFFDPCDSSDLYKELNEVTQLLCTACKILEATHSLDNKELRYWWKKHQEKDRVREESERREAEKEQLKKQAISKLTDKEKEALGL